MSGGSWGYLGRRMLDEVVRLEREDDPNRRALAPVLKALGMAMHMIEWVDSGDCGPGDEADAIRTVLAMMEDKTHGA